jgi:FtsZ-binding cell division protein ZapB
MSITDCKKVMREYLYEIHWLKEKIKDLENAIKVKDEYIEKLKKENEELQEYKWMYEDLW